MVGVQSGRGLSRGRFPMRDFYTTGQVAKICGISQQTVIRNFDDGTLEGNRVPGSKFRRIPHHCLVKFMRTNRIPLDRLEGTEAKVLIVDDDAEIVGLLVDVLTQHDEFKVATAATGFDAGLQVESFFPDVILLDYMLPVLNGRQVCERIRAVPEYSFMKIIIVSGVSDAAEIEMLKEVGDDFFRKPFNVTELRNRVRELTDSVPYGE